MAYYSIQDLIIIKEGVNNIFKVATSNGVEQMTYYMLNLSNEGLLGDLWDFRSFRGLLE